MTESEEAFARRAVRRKGLFLKLSVAGVIVAAGLVALYSIFWWRDHSYPVGPRAVIILLILLNARQNLRQVQVRGSAGATPASRSDPAMTTDHTPQLRKGHRTAITLNNIRVSESALSPMEQCQRSTWSKV